jgi:hypothetical protein
MGRGRIACIALGLAALAAAGGAAGAAPERPQVRFTAADQAAARAVVLKRADLANAPGWEGGTRKLNLSEPSPCTDFRPKQRDLVVTGGAHTLFSHPAGIVFDSEAYVLRTRRMVHLDWQRVVRNRRFAACLRTSAAKGLGAQGRVLEVRRLRFPQVAPFTAAWRLVIELSAGGRRERMFFDVVFLGRGRTELALSTTARYAERTRLAGVQHRLARRLVARVRA